MLKKAGSSVFRQTKTSSSLSIDFARDSANSVARVPIPINSKYTNTNDSNVKIIIRSNQCLKNIPQLRLINALPTAQHGQNEIPFNTSLKRKFHRVHHIKSHNLKYVMVLTMIAISSDHGSNEPVATKFRKSVADPVSVKLEQCY